MSFPKPLILELDSTDPRQCGQIHGESLRHQVRAMAEIRIGLMQNETNFKTKTSILKLANKHLPILKNFDADLYEELLGIAEGSGLSPEEIVVLNHYTDLRDLDPAVLDFDPDTKGCSTIYAPSSAGPLLGQTWDINGTALEHVVILKIKENQNSALLFSVAGCLGMTGMNQYSVGICINNLSSIDAKIGIVWPALVRKVLKQISAQKGCDVILKAPLGSGHHYSIADEKDFFGIETSGTKKKITQQGNKTVHFHTNHCLDEEMKVTHTVKSTSTTFSRYQKLEKQIPSASLFFLEDMYQLLSLVSIAPDPKAIETVATCGALIMNLTSKQALACMGPPTKPISDNPPLHLSISI